MDRYPAIPQSASLTAPFTQGGLILGITGGTGCFLSLCIRDRGGLVLDCDAVYHDLLTRDQKLLAAIEDRFPGTVENGRLQRKKLGSIVFSDPEALEDLNRITHSAVKAEVVRRLEEKPALAAIDAIALFEGGLAELCDTTVAVTAPEEVRIQRLMARDGISEEYARSRIGAQHKDDWFRQRCDHVLENMDTREHFQQKCLAFLNQFCIIE